MAVILSFCLIPQPASTQSPLPWMNTALAPAQRTELLIQAMTLDEKIQQIGNQAFRDERIARLRIHSGRTPNPGHSQARNSDVPADQRWQRRQGWRRVPEPAATGFPSGTLGAATFNPALNFAWGAVLGQETRNDAHHVLLRSSLNLNRHPYNGRAQEYFRRTHT